MAFVVQFLDQVHGDWMNLDDRAFPTEASAAAAEDEFGRLLTDVADDTRIIDTAFI
jgi:hypothetical protein